MLVLEMFFAAFVQAGTGRPLVTLGSLNTLLGGPCGRLERCGRLLWH